MTRTAARIAELDHLSRERSLTAAEEDELYRLVRLQRHLDLRRQRYATNPDYRRTCLERTTGWRRARGMKPVEMRTRDERGRFA